MNDKRNLEIIGYFVDFVHGGGPLSGHWFAFLKWMEEIGFTEEEINEATEALGKEIGREL